MKAVYLKDKTGNKVVTTPYYRIGDLFLTTIAENPSSYLGGTWELFGLGRTLVCVDTSQTEFNSVKKIGGEKTHKLTIEEMPSHNHDMDDATYGGYKNKLGIRGDGGGGTNRYTVHDEGTSGAQGSSPTSYVGNHTHSVKGSNSSTGGGNLTITEIQVKRIACPLILFVIFGEEYLSKEG